MLRRTNISFLPSFFNLCLPFELASCRVFALAARRKLLERARQAGSGGFKKARLTQLKEMWDGEEGEPVHCFGIQC